MAEWSRETPWRQGYFLDNAAILAFNLECKEAPEKTVVIVASHDCDLTQLPNAEPALEVIAGCLIGSLQGNFTHTKSPRKLHVEVQTANGIVFIELLAVNKISISKEMLVDFLPDSNLSINVDNLNIFQRWLALRYRRTAFPDGFESRLKSKPNKLDEKINGILRKYGASITAIFFDVDEGNDLEKIDNNDTYMLDITIIFGDKPDYDAAEKDAKIASDSIKELFVSKLYDESKQSWLDIELRYCESMSEDALTYKQSTILKQWRLEHVSLAEVPAQALLEQVL